MGRRIEVEDDFEVTLPGRGKSFLIRATFDIYIPDPADPASYDIEEITIADATDHGVTLPPSVMAFFHGLAKKADLSELVEEAIAIPTQRLDLLGDLFLALNPRR